MLILLYAIIHGTYGSQCHTHCRTGEGEWSKCITESENDCNVGLHNREIDYIDFDGKVKKKIEAQECIKLCQVEENGRVYKYFKKNKNDMTFKNSKDKCEELNLQLPIPDNNHRRKQYQ